MKKLSITLSFLLILSLLCLSSATATSGISVTVDNQALTFDVSPVVENGRTLVPLRAIFESLGATVQFDGATQKITAVKGATTVQLTLNSAESFVNGTPVKLDVPAKAISGRTLVPLRFVSEALGASVQWDSATRVITINSGASQPSQQQLAVHFINVGQGDSILIQTPGGKVVLIDGGPRTAGQVVVSYLKKSGISSIDVMISTHAHEDHIGGLISVLNEFPVGKVFDSGKVHTTKTFEDYLTLIDQKSIPFEEARAGMTIQLESGLQFNILNPAGNVGSMSLNNASVVTRLQHGQVSFLFTGDAEVAAENETLSRGTSKTTVLKVGHHGSKTSTSQTFLDAISPSYAVIQVGAGNTYGHPELETLDKLAAKGIKIYRNDLQGNIVFKTNGSSISVNVAPHSHTAPVQPTPPVTGKININTASFEELQGIVHIGPDRAQQIINLRPFRSLDDLTRVSGIGPARLQDIKNEGKAYVE